MSVSKKGRREGKMGEVYPRQYVNIKSTTEVFCIVDPREAVVLYYSDGIF